MKWQKSPPELVSVFESVVPGPPAVQRKMFGYPASFVNGNMFLGLFQDSMILRLSEDHRRELIKIKGAKIFEPMAGRPMKEYVVVPPTMLRDKALLSSWVSKAFAYGTSLRPKPKRAKSRKTAT